MHWYVEYVEYGLQNISSLILLHKSILVYIFIQNIVPKQNSYL